MSIQDFRNPEVHLPVTWRDVKSVECPSRMGVWPGRGPGEGVGLAWPEVPGGPEKLGAHVGLGSSPCRPVPVWSRRVTSLMASASSSVKGGVTWLNCVGSKIQPPPELRAPASVNWPPGPATRISRPASGHQPPGRHLSLPNLLPVGKPLLSSPGRGACSESPGQGHSLPCCGVCHTGSRLCFYTSF